MGRPLHCSLVCSYTCTALLLLGGCYDDSVVQDYQASVTVPDFATDTGTGSTSSPPTASITITEPTGQGSGPTTSGTWSGSGSGSGSGGEADAEGENKPQISLEVSPAVLTLAGHLELAVEHTADVDRIELHRGIEEKPVLQWHAGDPPPALLVTRGHFGEQLLFRARGYDADDNYATSDEVFVELQLPEPGTLLFEESFDVGSLGEGRAIAAGILVDEPKLLVGFDDDQSAVVGRYTAHGAPQMLAAPSDAALSIPTGIALDTDDTIIAVGVDLIGGKERAWVVRVDPHTAAVDMLFQGKVGEAATGCAVDPVSKRIYVSGYGPGVDNLSVPDAMIWALAEDGAMLWVKKWERPVPDKDKDAGFPNDRALAVAVLDDGDPVIVGESRFKSKDPNVPLAVWAFVHRYSPNGALEDEKSWVSADVAFGGAAHSVTPDRDNGLLVAGWSQVIEGAPRQATVFAFGPLLKEAEIYESEPVGDWIAQGVARLPTGDLVYAADFDDDGLGRHDAEVRGVQGLFGEPEWSHVFQAGDVARVGALTLTRDAHIMVVGTRRADGVNTMFLAGLHP